MIGESPRWHEGRLWFSNWGAGEVIAFDPVSGESETTAVPSGLPFSLDWLADGSMLLTSGPERALLRLEPDGSFVPHADLTSLTEYGWNEIVVDGADNVYVNSPGFDLMAGAEFAPGILALVAAGGSVSEVADDVAFPNGMTISPKGGTLIVAESYARRLTAFEIADDAALCDRRVWADLGDGVPDGICFDASGAVWYADVPNKRCVRVREGGEELERVELDRGAFACMLGGEDGRTLFIVAAEWRGPERMLEPPRSGQLLAVRVTEPHAGRP